VRRALAALALLAAAACTAAPPVHTLVVRHPERKCALVKFAFCSQFATVPVDRDAEATDAGAD
jgi:hypothetical protein